jgi:hypothetical protein
MNLRSRGRGVRQPCSPESLAAKLSFHLQHAVAPSTRLTYSSALKTYLDFCEKHHFAIDPTPQNLAFYIAWMADSVSPRTINSYLTGIAFKLEILYPEIRINRRHPIVCRALAGCARSFGQPVKRKAPLQISHLESAINAHPRPLSFDDTLFLAMLTCGFYGLQRLGELAIPDDPRRRSFRSLTLRHTAIVKPNQVEYLLPTHKTDPRFEGSKIVLQNLDTVSCPVLAFKRYLRARDSRFRLLAPLWLTSTGQPPTRGWFLQRFRKLFPSEFSGHSLRAGGATALAQAGVSDTHIKALGRWSSDAFEAYIRSHPADLHSLLHMRPVFQCE